MEDKLKVLAQNIKYLRKKKGLNQEQLANALNIKRSNIAAYETKNVEPRLRIILEMAQLFNVDLQSFLQTKMTDNEIPKTFDAAPSLPVETVDNIELSKKADIKTFIEKSIKIRKILIGFKTFYAFRRSKIEQITPPKEKIMSDVDNFIMLIEHLLTHNETIIKAINSKQGK